MIRRGLFVLGTLASLITGFAPTAQACSSCGSGGADPLILYPNERWKLYTAFTRQGDFHNVSPKGKVTTNYGPSEKKTLTVSGGMLLTNRSFVTLTIPVAQNSRSGSSKTGVSDASLFGRYTAIEQTFDEPWIPQVQLMGGYKHSMSRSIHSTQDFYLLDVYGNGYSEIKGGYDVWFGMKALKGGASQLITYTLPKEQGGIKQQPGLALRTTVTLGLSYSDFGKVLIGANLLSSEKLKADGKEVALSEVADNGAFVTVDYGFTPVDLLRLTLARTALFGENRNTVKSQSVILAFMKSFY